MRTYIDTLVGFLEWSVSSPLSELVALLSIAVAWLWGPAIARALGWRVPGTRLAIVGLGVALVPTVVVRVGRDAFIWDPSAVLSCDRAFEQPWASPLEVLNLLLFVPFAAGVALASGRLWVSLAVTVPLALAIEPVQAITALGECDVEDTARYLLGGLAAAAAVAGISVIRAHGAHRAPSLAPESVARTPVEPRG